MVAQVPYLGKTPLAARAMPHDRRAKPMATMRINLPTSRGYSLSGAVELPPGTVRGAALFAHCFTCTKQSRAAIDISRQLALQGIACLRFDFTGLGDSEGEFGHAGFATDIEDIRDAAHALIDRYGGPILLIGHSLGGAGVLAALDDIGREHVAAIATIAAPADVPHALHRVEGDLDAIRRDGEGTVSIGGRPFTVGSPFLERAQAVDLKGEVAALKCPLLILHSPTDALVGIENATALFGAARHPKSFVSLDDADHLLLNDADADFAAGVIAAWATRYMKPRPLERPGEGEVRVATGHGRFGTQVATPAHAFTADEPRSYGGDDTGPTPYDLLLASLGTCTAMTMKMYADRKQWPLEGVSIRLRHERDHDDDHDKGDTAPDVVPGAKMQALYRSIAITGDDLSQAQREKLMEIADRCPVHRTLEGDLHIHTEEAD
jgi:putative redox protein